MNIVAIAIHIEINDKFLLVGMRRQYPKLAALKAIARYELGRLKRKVRDVVERLAVNRVIGRVAMAFNPMPSVALA